MESFYFVTSSYAKSSKKEPKTKVDLEYLNNIYL